MGTGTTARSCGKFGVHCIGSELSPDYFTKYLNQDAVATDMFNTLEQSYPQKTISD
jgi:hypothetical protein